MKTKLILVRQKITQRIGLELGVVNQFYHQLLC